ncbi:RNA polymerase sigma factor [Tenuifilaceae bacterium CYCD]|nr:RNA polymerase sigma factor [Tenuifilaceae bacterium CYCD]
MEDSILIQRIIDDNDHKAFAEFVDKYQRMVIVTCRGFVGSYHEAEDLAQDVFVELYESLPSFRKESKLSTWIYRIAVNKSLNYVRKKKREKLLLNFGFGSKDNKGECDTPLTSFVGSEADHGIVLAEEKKMLKDAINKLPQNQKAALILSKYQDLSYKEIAEVMEVSISSVESLLFRAKSNLRAYLVDSQKK